VGKRIEIHGPDCWDILGVGLDEEICDLLIRASQSRDKKMFNQILQSFRVMRIRNNAKALVVDAKILEGKAKVILFTGIYKGMSGWIPIEWLRGNEKRPTLSDDP
jgi:hypothetical protein